jgi:hypothetical protein
MEDLMKKIVFFCALVLSFSSSAQVKFFKLFGDNGYDEGKGIVQLADSSYMVTGRSSSFLDAPSQAFLLKVDKFGEHVWAKDFGGSESDAGVRVMSWNDSVFFMAGYSNSYSSGDFDAYLIKTDKNGNLISQQTYGDQGWEKINDALLTPDSNLIMVGETTSTSNSNSNFYILRTDKDGNEIWNLNFGSSGEDRLNSVKQLNDTIFYAVGTHFNSDSTLNKGVVIKFHINGTVEWLNEFGQYGEYELNDFYFFVNSIYAVGQRKYPETGDFDNFNLRIFLTGAYESEDSGHSSGDVMYKGLTPYGSNGYVYVASTYKNQFSMFNTQDVAYERNYGSLYWYEEYVQIGSGMDDEHGDIIPTNDLGAAAVGTVQSDEWGGSAVYVIKIGPNDDFPAVNFTGTQSLVYLEELLNTHDLNVIPNPASDQFKILTKKTGNVSLQVYDALGRVCSNFHFEKEMLVNTSEWTNGLYILQFNFENGDTKSMKLHINH